MASTLTRTAAAFAVATLPILAGATTAQASDSRRGDSCKDNHRSYDRRGDDTKKRSAYDDGPARMTISRYGEKCDDHKPKPKPDYTKPTHKPTYDHRHDDKKHDDRYDKKRHHRDDHKKHDRRHHHKKRVVHYDPLNEVRSATAKYFSVAAAERDGYHRAASGPLRGCITETPGKNSPAMGFHWGNAHLMDSKVELTKPEALVYEPNSLGKLDLVAVEYVVPRDAWHKAGNLHRPKLFGLEYELVSIPGVAPFYALHAWVWKFNPDGTHAAFNPLASCKYASLLPK